MKENIFHYIGYVFAAIGGIIGGFIGEGNGFFYTLVALMVADYISGVIHAIIAKELSSAVGFKGIAKKILILLLVGVANMLDIHVLGGEAVLRTTAIFFYIANEGISLIENAAKLGLPIPKKLKDILAQLKKQGDGDTDESNDTGGKNNET